MSHRECLGAAKCPYGAECFAERARERAMRSQVVVTNHSLLAIDAVEGVPMIPEYDTVVIDEAHELVARVTQAATDELSVSEVDRTARRASRHVDGSEADDLADAGDALRDAIDATPPGRIDAIPQELADALVLVRDAARALVSAFPKDLGDDAVSTQAKGWAQELFKTSERMAANADADVLWVAERDRQRGGNQLCVAPLQVFGTMRDKLLTDKTVVMTSATLKLGGDFDAVATSVGLRPSERVVSSSEWTSRSAPTVCCRGAASTWARRSTTASRRSCTSPATSRRRAATDSSRPRSGRSRTWSTPPTGAPSACSPPAGPPRPRPRRCANGCRT